LWPPGRGADIDGRTGFIPSRNNGPRAWGDTGANWCQNSPMIDPTRYPPLARIHSPADLRQRPETDLRAIADELRSYLIESVASSGGHFGAGLGVVELTVALHWLFEPPDDRLVWDVGHQCYPHKILT